MSGERRGSEAQSHRSSIAAEQGRSGIPKQSRSAFRGIATTALSAHHHPSHPPRPVPRARRGGSSCPAACVYVVNVVCACLSCPGATTHLPACYDGRQPKNPDRLGDDAQLPQYRSCLSQRMCLSPLPRRRQNLEAIHGMSSSTLSHVPPLTTGEFSRPRRPCSSTPSCLFCCNLSLPFPPRPTIRLHSISAALHIRSCAGHA